MIALSDVHAAAKRLAGVAHRTPVLTGRSLDEATGAGRVLLKAENLQRVGAFKFRGAYNAVSALAPERGVATVSSGNHAQALALAARLHEIPAVILMPEDAPAGKLAATRSYGAEVVLFDRYGADREELLAELVAERGLTPVHPYDDPLVMAGQGTVALELLEDAGPLDVLLVCVGGGGLISGCATAVDGQAKVIGVEPETGDDTLRSLRAGERVRIPVPHTIADGQQLPIPGELTFPVVQRLVDDIVTVTDDEIVAAMRFLFERVKTVAEPSGACAFAALLAGKIPDVGGARVGVTISGGNVTAERFAELLGVIALFQSGWHWPIVAAVVVALATIVCVIVIEKPDREWLLHHKRELRGVIWGSIGLIALAVLVGQLHNLEGMLKRVQDGDPLWLGLGVAIESVSFVGYVALTYEIFKPHAPRLTLGSCIEITFGGVVATRLLSAGGAGGIAFTSWALHAAGMGARSVAKFIAAFLALLYAPYVAALGLGFLGGGVPAAVAWISGGVAIAAVLSAILLTLIPGDLERRAKRVAAGKGRMAKLAVRASSIPAVAGDSVRTALDLARERPRLIAWALLWWAGDVAVLYVCFRAFGPAPALGVLIVGYFLGHIGNFIPVPGGIGGVEGGMVGVFAACGMPLSLAVVGTIAYTVISTWLPVAPGLGAYLSLRRRVQRWRDEDSSDEELAELTAAVQH